MSDIEFTLRPYQERIVDRVVDEFQTSGVVVLNAPVGVGKTIIGTAVAEELGDSFMYIPSTKALQSQYATDFPEYPLIQGHVNYPCGGVHGGVECPECGASTGNLFNHLVLVHDFSADGATMYSDGECKYAVAKARASAAVGANANPWYHTLESLYVGDFAGRGLGIYDEADVLDGMVDSITGSSVSLDRLWTYTGVWLDEVPSVGEAQMLLSDMVSRMEGRTLTRGEVRTLSGATRMMTMLAEGGTVLDIEGGSLIANKIDISGFCRGTIWPLTGRQLFMSASLSNIGLWASYMGIDDFTPLSVEHPFPVENRTIRLQPVADMGRNGYGDRVRVKRMAEAISRLRNGRTLVHVSSQFQAAALKQYIPDAITHASGDPEGKLAAVGRFVAAEDSLLISQSNHRGLDLKDDLCRTNIVAKAPWPAGNLAHRRKDSFRGWYPMVAAAQLAQASGRGVRGPDDWCDTYLLDAGCSGLIRHTPKWFQEAMK